MKMLERKADLKIIEWSCLAWEVAKRAEHDFNAETRERS